MEWNFRAIPLERPEIIEVIRNKFPDITPDYRRIDAQEYIEAGNIVGVLVECGSNGEVLFVLDNWKPLKQTGMYEEALLFALTDTLVNLYHVPLKTLQFLLEQADRDKLIAEGDNLPDDENFTLYRGVSGHGVARRLRGISWTSNPDRAKWFACRFEDLAKPAVFRAEVPRELVYAYSEDRDESKFICLIPPDLKLKCVWKESE